MREMSLEQIPNLWRAEALTAAAAQRVATGFQTLDRILGGGWPRPGLLEVLCNQSGIGELQLLLPLMHPAASVSKPVLWINPPYDPHAMALAQHGFDPTLHWCLQGLSYKDALWATEQSLRSSACTLLLCWLHPLHMPDLRRLKLAAVSGHCVAVLFRDSTAAAQPTPANLRLRLTAMSAGLQVEVLKVQGGRPDTVLLPMNLLRGWWQAGTS